MSFSGKTVVITGSTGNLGRAVARLFMDQDARVVLVDLHRDALLETFGMETAQLMLAPANLLEPESASRVIDAAVERYRRVDVLCNLAGGFHMGEVVHETSAASWNGMFDMNVRTLLNITHAVVPHMVGMGGGKIVNVSAYSAQKGAARMGAYIASKSAVMRLTESMAAELRDKNINVNCVLPTILDTPENRAAMPDADPACWVAPHDLASVIRFLSSDDAKAMHGASLPVTGLS